MVKWLISPPVAFAVIFFAAWSLAHLFSRISFKPKGTAEGSKTSYACGEDNYDHMAQPDYTNFFPFAFFFTLAHVATLIMATVPVETVKTFTMAVIYVIGIILGLYILLKE